MRVLIASIFIVLTFHGCIGNAVRDKNEVVDKWTVGGYEIKLIRNQGWAGPQNYRYNLYRLGNKKLLGICYAGQSIDDDGCHLVFKKGQGYQVSDRGIFVYDKCKQIVFPWQGDTLVIDGPTVVFLEPKDYDVYDTLARKVSWNFAFAILETNDSLRATNNLNEISVYVARERYIKVMDCLHKPVIIDRDSIIYGFIMTSPERKVFIEEDTILSSIHNMQRIRAYFH